MRKSLQFLATFLIVASFSACNSSSSEDEKPLVSGIELENMKSSIRPQDDFYSYVNGTWQEIEIPSNKDRYNAFNALGDNVDASLKQILQKAAKDATAGSKEKKVGDFYTSYMDVSLINSKGIAPLQKTLDTIANANTYEDITLLFADLYAQGTDMPLGYFIGSDFSDTTQYITSFSQSGLGLGDKSYYILEDARYIAFRAKYKTYIRSLMGLAGFANTEQMATNIVALETKLAAIQWSIEENRVPANTYNKYTKENAKLLLGAFDFEAYLNRLGLNISQMIIKQPSYLEEFGKLFKETSVSEWKEYLSYKYVNSLTPYLSDDFVDLQFDFFSKTLKQIEVQTPREERAVANANFYLSDIMAELYVKKDFSPAAKIKVQEMTQNIKNAFEQSINELEWMSPATKQAAIIKLHKMKAKIAYPDTWKDYSALDIKSDDLVGNITRFYKWNDAKEIEKLGTLVTNDEWMITPQTVNADYSVYSNEIIIPAAILQAPFFNPLADDAVNYGGIGAVIGHIMINGFDSTGSLYDGDGNLLDWWLESDKIAFNKLSQKLIAQYDAYKPFDDLSVNGTLTLNINMADLGGANLAYKAYKNSLNGKTPATLDGFTGEQRFFIGNAQIFRQKFREEALRDRLLTDPHAPGIYRVNGVVTNMSEFYEVYDVKPGDSLYKAEEDRIKIW